MGLWKTFLKKMVSEPRLASLGEDENRAMVEALVLCVAADHRLTAEERYQLRGEVQKLPWSWDHRGEIEPMIDALTAKIAKIPDAAGIHVYAGEIAARLPHGEPRQLVYKMLLSICWADGIVQEEEHILEIFRRHLGLSDDEGQSLLRQVEAERTPTAG